MNYSLHNIREYIYFVTSVPHFPALCFIVLHRFFFSFNKLNICGNSASSQFTGGVFPTAFAHVMSVSHFGNSLNISDFFIIIIFVMAICGQSSLMLHLQKDCNLNAHMMISIFLAITF